MIRDDAALLAHKRRVDAERKAQAILRTKAQSPAALMARVAAAPRPRAVAPIPFTDVILSVVPVRVTNG